MDKDIVFALISITSHLGVMVAVAWHLLRQMQLERTDEESEGDEGGGGGGGPRRHDPRRPEPLGGGGLPLPDAVQSRTRLRDAGRIGDARPLPGRRRTSEPLPARSPARR